MKRFSLIYTILPLLFLPLFLPGEEEREKGQQKRKVVVICSDMYTTPVARAFGEIRRTYPDIAERTEFVLIAAHELRDGTNTTSGGVAVEKGASGTGQGEAVETTATPANRMERISRTLSHASLIIVDCLSWQNARKLTDALRQAHAAGAVLLAVNDPRTHQRGIEEIGLQYDAEVRAYFSARGWANIKNMLLCALQKYCGFLEGITLPPPEPSPEFGIYHPRAPEPRYFETPRLYADWYESSAFFQPGAPYVGIAFFPTNYTTGQLAEIDALVSALEKEGLNVFPTFGFPDDELLDRFYVPPTTPLLSETAPDTSLPPVVASDSGSRPEREETLPPHNIPDPRMSNFQPTPSATEATFHIPVKCIVAMTMKFANPDACVPRLQRVGVPIINIMSVQATEAEWRASRQGLSISEVPWQIALPELLGLIQPTVVGTRVLKNASPAGAMPGAENIIERAPVPERVARIVARVKRWLALQEKPNYEKRVAFIYYNYPPGKHRIGASYLNVFESLEIILERMKKEGYALGDDSLSAETLLSEALSHGRNVPSSAPGELEKLVSTGKCVMLPLATYKEWYQELPTEFREFVQSHWGSPQDAKLMTWTIGDAKYFVLPCVRRGNVILLPQPLRGWSEEDPEKLYHCQTLPPPHQYIASYLWLAREFKADAVVHVGRHGTHEFLSGKELALSEADAPDVLIGSFPNLYIYIVDGLGEGIIAKRRGAATIVDHGIPPLKKGCNVADLAVFGELDAARSAALLQNPALADSLARQMIELAQQKGIDKELNLPASLEDVQEQAEHIAHYAREIKEKLYPCGLHTFGTSPEDELLMPFAEIISEAYNGTPDAAHFRELLRRSADTELDSLMTALDGGYVRPGPGNDPVRCPAALPTGKNFYTFDPRKIPRKTSWELGARLAEESIEQYRAKHNGAYPDKMAFNVWCVEVVRHEGVVESQILRLLGVKPVWDAQDRVVDLELIPRSELGRPRVDVVVTISGIYRDAFGFLVVMLDRAARLAALAEEEDNHVRIGLLGRRERFIKAGFDSSRAEMLAAARIFGPPPGEYGTKVHDAIADGARWNSDREIADVYLNRMCHAYGADFWNLKSRDAFETALSGVKMAFHSRSSNVYGVLDNDDSFQYAGGLICAVRAIDGQSPSLFVTNLQDPRRAHLQHINEYLGMEARSRYFNPEFIRHMMNEGYGGGKEMTEFAEYLWGWQVTVPEAVGEHQWMSTYEVYVADIHNLGMAAFFEKYNPWAQQVITAQLLEVHRKGYWPSAAPSVLGHIAEVYARSVDAYGIACAGITCANPELTAEIIARLRDRAPALARSLEQKVQEATKRSLEDQIRAVRTERLAIQKKLQRTRGTSGSAPAPPSRQVRGFALRKITDADRLPTAALPPLPGGRFGLVTSLSFICLTLLSGFFKGLLDAVTMSRTTVRSVACLWSVLIHGAVLAVASTVALGPVRQPDLAETSPPSFSVRLARLEEQLCLSLDSPNITIADDTHLLPYEDRAVPEDEVIFPDPPEVWFEFSALPLPCQGTREDLELFEPHTDYRMHARVVVPQKRHQPDRREAVLAACGEVSAQGEDLSSCEAKLDRQHNKPPAYPVIARRKGWEGAVLIEARVAPDGSCLGAEVIESSGYAVLDAAAREAVLGWRFIPALRDGKPTEGTIRFRVVFRLIDEEKMGANLEKW